MSERSPSEGFESASAEAMMLGDVSEIISDSTTSDDALFEAFDKAVAKDAKITSTEDPTEKFNKLKAEMKAQAAKNQTAPRTFERLLTTKQDNQPDEPITLKKPASSSLDIRTGFMSLSDDETQRNLSEVLNFGKTEQPVYPPKPPSEVKRALAEVLAYSNEKDPPRPPSSEQKRANDLNNIVLESRDKDLGPKEPIPVVSEQEVNSLQMDIAPAATTALPKLEKKSLFSKVKRWFTS
jgi:hypothetical protein